MDILSADRPELWVQDGAEVYTLTTTKLGAGTFGSVTKAVEKGSRKPRQVAIKIENEPVAGMRALRREAEVLRLVGIFTGFPTLLWTGNIGGKDAIAMDLLGANLDTLRKESQYCYPLKTVLMIGLQMLDRLESLHSRGYIHNDLKPSNIVIGGKDYPQDILYLIDFGHCVQFKTNHGSFTFRSLNGGTLLFSPIDSHTRLIAHPKHDLESLGYIMVYLLTWELPWKRIPKGDDRGKLIFESKIASKGTLCAELPEEFQMYMAYVHGLRGYSLKTDYDYLRSLFHNLLRRAGLEDDGKFCWVQSRPQSPNQRSWSSLLAPFTRAVQAVPAIPKAVVSVTRALWQERITRVTPLAAVPAVPPPAPDAVVVSPPPPAPVPPAVHSPPNSAVFIPRLSSIAENNLPPMQPNGPRRNYRRILRKPGDVEMEAPPRADQVTGDEPIRDDHDGNQESKASSVSSSSPPQYLGAPVVRARKRAETMCDAELAALLRHHVASPRCGNSPNSSAAVPQLAASPPQNNSSSPDLVAFGAPIVTQRKRYSSMQEFMDDIGGGESEPTVQAVHVIKPSAKEDSGRGATASVDSYSGSSPVLQRVRNKPQRRVSFAFFA